MIRYRLHDSALCTYTASHIRIPQWNFVNSF